MKARMQELLGLLTMVVERVRAANARTEWAEARAAQMSGLLDAMADENAALRADLERAEDEAAADRETIRALRERADAGERLAEALEARAAEAELRIRRAADALGLPASVETPALADEAHPRSAALH